MGRLLNVREVAERLSASPWAVYRLVREGRLPVVRLGARRLRFRPESVEAAFDQHCARAAIKRLQHDLVSWANAHDKHQMLPVVQQLRLSGAFLAGGGGD